MKIRFPLPSSNAELREWHANDLKQWRPLVDDAVRFSRAAGRTAGFTESLRTAREVLRSDDPAGHPALRSRRVRRAVVTLWAEDAQVAEETFRSPVFDRVASLEHGGSSLLVLTLAQAYYRFFDLLDEWEDGLFNVVSTRLVALGRRSSRAKKSHDVFTAFTQNRAMVVGPRAPRRIAAHVQESGVRLDDYLTALGVGDYAGGRFYDLVQQETYLERIRRSDPLEEHDFLTDLTADSLRMAPMSDRRMFGHHVVEAMTKASSAEPHPLWRNTIIDIAGDPRTRGTPLWNRWWKLVSEQSRERVIAWLATQDLQLFLDAVEAYGEREYDEDLIRMFPDRKQFLQGLHRENLIRETRLLAAREARQAIRLQVGSDLRTEIFPVVGNVHSQLAVIYLDCGDFHVVEGSHNFKLWVYVGNRPFAFEEWRQGSYDVSELRNPRYDDDTTHQAFTHYSSLSWIPGALMYLSDNGIDIRPDRLMSPATYSYVKGKFELPVGNKRRRRT